MNLRKTSAAVLALALCASLTAPVAATGYAGGPWTNPGTPYYPGVNYTPSTSSGSGSSGGGSSRQDTDRNLYYPTGTSNATAGGGGTTTIADPQTPLASTPGQTPGSEKLKNNFNAVALTASAVKKGADGSITLTNVSVIDPALLKGQTGVVACDVKVGNSVVARVYLDAAKVANLKAPIDISLSTDAADTAAVKARFDKHFDGNFAVVSLAQKSSFGAPVTIAIHSSVLKGLDLEKLNVLLYNKSTNKYKKVDPKDVKVEGAYVYTTTDGGGELVFTDTNRA